MKIKIYFKNQKNFNKIKMIYIIFKIKVKNYIFKKTNLIAYKINMILCKY